MALTKASQTPQSSASNSAGNTTTGSWLATGYGVSGAASVTNGGTGPTVPCDFVIDVADDASGTNAKEWSRQTSLTGNSVATLFPFGLTLSGGGADYPYYRTRFTGNTGQAVTVEATASSTTAL